MGKKRNQSCVEKHAKDPYKKIKHEKKTKKGGRFQGVVLRNNVLELTKEGEGKTGNRKREGRLATRLGKGRRPGRGETEKNGSQRAGLMGGCGATGTQVNKDERYVDGSQ